jgi:hypothetical protein
LKIGVSSFFDLRDIERFDCSASDWVGTNDTPTSGEWSPTNNT